MPYRSWCEVCVKARGRKREHYKQKEDKKEDELKNVPRMVMDYLYMSEEDRNAGKHPIFCMKDESTGCRFARLVARKGLGADGEVDWLILEACAELKAWGHLGGEGSRIILKSDGEPALCALRDAIGRFHGGVVITETSARGESQSNGVAEQNVSIVSEFIRVLKLQIDEKTGLSIGVDHAIYPDCQVVAYVVFTFCLRRRWKDTLRAHARPQVQDPGGAPRRVRHLQGDPGGQGEEEQAGH